MKMIVDTTMAANASATAPSILGIVIARIDAKRTAAERSVSAQICCSKAKA